MEQLVAEQWELIEIAHIEQVEVQELYLDIIAHQEVAKLIEGQHLVAQRIEVEHLQDIMAHVAIHQEHLPTEVLEVELAVMVVDLDLRQEVLQDQVIQEAVEVVTDALLRDHHEARVALEVLVVLRVLLQQEGLLEVAAADHQVEDLVEVEDVINRLKFHYIFINKIVKNEKIYNFHSTIGMHHSYCAK